MANRIMLNQTSYHGAGAIQELPAEVKNGLSHRARALQAAVKELFNREQ